MVTAPQTPYRSRARRRRLSRTSLRSATLLAAIAVVLLGAWRSLAIYTVQSASMEPALHCSNAPYCQRLRPDRIVIDTWMYRVFSIHRGDIVIIASTAVEAGCRSSDDYVKRIVALPGETVTQRNGHLVIDGTVLHEKYLPADELGRGPAVQRTIVPAGRYFVLGDDRAHSCDSRDFGTVPSAAILGKVLFHYPTGWLRSIL
jgi:signal peptidase I